MKELAKLVAQKKFHVVDGLKTGRMFFTISDDRWTKIQSVKQRKHQYFHDRRHIEIKLEKLATGLGLNCEEIVSPVHPSSAESWAYWGPGGTIFHYRKAEDKSQDFTVKTRLLEALRKAKVKIDENPNA